MPKTIFNVDSYSIGALLSSDEPLYEVPKFQRRYSWSNSGDNAQWETLWEDLITAKTSTQPEYFLGTIVVIGNGKPFTIIDGQQRLATLIAMFAAIRDHLHELGEKEIGKEIQKKLILRTDYRGNQMPILTLGVADREEFRQYIQLPLDDPARIPLYSKLPKTGPGRPRTNFIRGLLEYYYGKIKDYVQNLPDTRAKYDQLIDLQEFLEKKITMIRIEVDSDIMAATIFETLNDRGLDLSVSDLVKNHLLSICRNEKEATDVFSVWEAIVKMFSDEAISPFLRHQWMSRSGVITERQLYGALKKDITDRRASPIAVTRQLAEDAETYARLLMPVLGDTCAWELMSLSEMRLRQGLPFLMAAKAVAKSEREFERAVRLVESLTVRYTIVGNRNPNQLERVYAKWAVMLRDKGFGDFDTIRDEARKMCPDDKDFSENFASLQDLKAPQARYILRKLAQYRGTKEVEIAMTKVDLEHILPQNPSRDWLEELGCSSEQAEAWSQLLGNLTLMSGPWNRKASNKTFVEKRDTYYVKSKITLTSELRSYRKWGLTQIQKRQKKLAEEAPSAWLI
ncbi:MAG: DUF262 domain-containing protein [Chloroflexi bacterium]|nr:DUF262 domain-containing protein [Chloroflexota bacterium]